MEESGAPWRVEADVSGVSDSAALVEQAFARAFDSVERQMGRAARTGELSFRAMVDAIIADLGRLAVQQFITAPIEGFLSGLFEFGGARAGGGPVAAGRSYLVGERGPELFTPAGHGAIAPAGSFGGRGGVTVNVTARDAASFLRSEGQIAAMLSRAVMRGQRGM
ncbi:MAG: phage tail tape measure C-terminal domain-containing protein [Micropepsaceae bacterium]